MIRLTTWLLACLALAAAGADLPLRFDGVLGQSSRTGPPLPFLEADAMVTGPDGRLWVAAGSRLHRLTAGPGHELVDSQALPGELVAGSLVTDGERCCGLTQSGQLLSFDPRTAAPKLLAEAPGRALAMARPGTGTGGFSSRAELFVLRDDGVYGWRLDGEAVGKVLPLPVLDGTRYECLAWEPWDNGLIVGSGYPDMTLRRFAGDGREVSVDGWPRRRIFSLELSTVNGRLWALVAGGSVVEVPPAFGTGQLATLPAGWSQFPRALTRGDDGSWYLACSQGLVTRGKGETAWTRRIGGLPGVEALAIGADGTVYALASGRQRIVRLMLDDLPDAPLRANGNEPFRIGNGWNGRGGGIAWDGTGLLVTDRAGSRLWRFVGTPERLQWPHRPPPWEVLAEQLATPGPVAAADNQLVMATAKGLLRASLTTPAALTPLPLEGVAPDAIRLLAATPDAVFAATGNGLAGFAADGTRRWWRDDLGQPAGLAADGDVVAMADGAGNRVLLLDDATGATRAELAAAGVPGGMTPGPVALRGRWLVVADARGSRLLRCRF